MMDHLNDDEHMDIDDVLEWAFNEWGNIKPEDQMAILEEVFTVIDNVHGHLTSAPRSASFAAGLERIRTVCEGIRNEMELAKSEHF